MSRKFKRISCSEKKQLIQKQISLMKEPNHLGVFCVEADQNLEKSQEVIDNSILGNINCSCVFKEDCQELSVPDELDYEDKIQSFMNRYPVEQAEEFLAEIN